MLGSLFGIELIVVVCTPKPEPVKLVILKLDELLGVLASIIELTTRIYCIVPDASESGRLGTMVAVLPDTVQVVAIVLLL